MAANSPKTSAQVILQQQRGGCGEPGLPGRRTWSPAPLATQMLEAGDIQFIAGQLGKRFLTPRSWTDIKRLRLSPRARHILQHTQKPRLGMTHEKPPFHGVLSVGGRWASQVLTPGRKRNCILPSTHHTTKHLAVGLAELGCDGNTDSALPSLLPAAAFGVTPRTPRTARCSRNTAATSHSCSRTQRAMKCFPLRLLWGSRRLLIVEHGLSGNCLIDSGGWVRLPHAPST